MNKVCRPFNRFLTITPNEAARLLEAIFADSTAICKVGYYKMANEKWYQGKALMIAVSVFLTSIACFQSCQIQQNQTRIREENEEIKHRLDYRDSKEWVTIVNGAKDREKAYFEIRGRYERILNHCRGEKDGCKLPNELSILPTERQFDSLEAMILKDK